MAGRVRAMLASAAVCVALIAVPACGSSSGGSTGAATIKFATDNSDMGGQVFVAKDKGYFSEEDLDVQPQVFAQGIDGIDAVLGGQADIAVATSFAAVTRLQSERLVILGSVAVAPPGWHKLAVRTSVSKPEELKGKAFGYAAGTAEQYVTDEYIKSIGLQLDDVDLKPFTALFDMVTALQSGKIDAAWIWGDGVEQVKDDANIKVWFDDSVVSKGTNYFYLATKDYAAKNKDAIGRFFTASDKAAQYMTSDQDDAAAIIAKAVKGTKDGVKGYMTGTEYTVGMTAQDLTSLDSFVKWGTETGVFKLKNGAEDYLDLDALRSVLPDRVTV